MTTIQNPRLPTNPGELGAMIREANRRGQREGYREGHRDGLREGRTDVAAAHQRGLREGYVDGANDERKTAKHGAERLVILGMLAGFTAAMLVTWFVIGVTGGL